jgi:hypothetical protein
MSNNQIMEEPTTAYSSHLPKVFPMRQMDSMDKTRSIEESRYGNSSYFPEDLPQRTAPSPTAAPWTQRMRGFWTFSPSSYSIIHTPDRAARVRHIAMVAILLLRTAMSALSILSVVIQRNIAGIVIYGLLALLTFWFAATCLAIIGDAEGDKRVKGIVVVGYIQFLLPWWPYSSDRWAAHLRFRILPLQSVLTAISARNAGISILFSASACLFMPVLL